MACSSAVWSMEMDMATAADAIHSYWTEAKGPETDSSGIASAKLCQLQYVPSLVIRIHISYCNTVEFEAVPSEVWDFFSSSIDYLQKIFYVTKRKINKGRNTIW